ncbi:MAG: hypothetical protein ACI85I_000800 [Arenicella sp.]|jgi:hypothetical protein
MDDIVNLPFGEGNEIFLSEISIRRDIPDRELKEKGNLLYRLQYHSDGFSIDAKIQDSIGNIQYFIDGLKHMHEIFSGNASWDNAHVTIFTDMFVIFEFKFEINDTGRINLDFDIEYKYTKLKYNGYIDQSYLPIWIKELGKIFNQ